MNLTPRSHGDECGVLDDARGISPAHADCAFSRGFSSVLIKNPK